jgi:hypothetical protein
VRCPATRAMRRSGVRDRDRRSSEPTPGSSGWTSAVRLPRARGVTPIRIAGNSQPPPIGRAIAAIQWRRSHRPLASITRETLASCWTGHTRGSPAPDATSRWLALLEELASTGGSRRVARAVIQPAFVREGFYERDASARVHDRPVDSRRALVARRPKRRAESARGVVDALRPMSLGDDLEVRSAKSRFPPRAQALPSRRRAFARRLHRLPSDAGVQGRSHGMRRVPQRRASRRARDRLCALPHHAHVH